MKITSEVKIFSIILVAAVGLVAFAVVPTLRQPSTEDIVKPREEPKITRDMLVTKDSHMRGKPDAARTLVVFSDFQCPQCKNSAPKVEAILAENKDQLNMVYHNFQARPDHFNAKILDRAAEAAGMQGKFWEMHDLLFKNQPDLIVEDLKAVKAKLTSMAESLKLDLTKFKADSESPATEKRYTEDNAIAAKCDVHATPWAFGIDPQGKVTYLPETEMVKKWLRGEPLDGLLPAPKKQ